ncbi:pirin family protein [Bacillus sp. UNC41MFS5]|uniref:pirin family protein n=1 Tax=Bacillus sp. UNC41MFS5 TaxID=1449046 RepID=UPI00047E7DC2|nr:pirin family protein [Bacillus sp. UNC41MFS5]
MNILRHHQSYSNGHKVFNLTFKRPGLIWQDTTLDDFAFGALSRIDHAKLGQGAFVKMHEHINDEILSYMWNGEMLHKDSDGTEIMISPSKHMLMNAGRSFFHEETTPNGTVEMLQIFIRPSEADLEPKVQFFDTNNKNEDWKLIAGPKEMSAPLEIRQNIAVYDAHAKNGAKLEIPKLENYTPWLYVMNGAIKAGEETLYKGDAVTGNEKELQEVELIEDTTLVLFLVDLNAQMTFSGNFSGLKR